MRCRQWEGGGRRWEGWDVENEKEGGSRLGYIKAVDDIEDLLI